MTNRYPDPGEIRALRKSAGLTQREVGTLLHTTSRVVQQWETTTGKFSRKMHPAFWDLLQIKLGA